MKRLLFTAALCILLAAPSEPLAVGPRGGGGGRGGGGARPAPRPSAPNISRPAPSRPAPSRPSAPAGRPGGGIGPGNISRPSMPAPRPNPGGGISRPNVPSGPNINRPSTLPGSRPPIYPGTGLARPGDGSRPTTGGIVPRPGGDGRPGIATRPSPGTPDRPGISGGLGPRPGTLPSIPIGPGIGDRPGIADRPTTLPSHPDRPGIADRPGRPGDGIRPPIHTGDRTIVGNVNNINVNRWAQYNRGIATTRPVWSRPAYWNRPWYGNRPAWYWGRPWYRYHYTWHHGFWNYWRRPPAVWFGTGLAIGWLSSPGDTVIYNNPYYLAPATPIYDYAQPIPIPEPDQGASAFPPTPDDAVLEAGDALPTTAPPAPEPDEATKEANRLFNEGRDLFKAGKYADAQSKAEQAIKKLPSDATLHEFRGLTLFAQGKYKDSAAAIYAVLAAGPGWDWETMEYLYGDQEVYTKQLRALEKFAKEDKTAAYAYFLLAYHYLVLGSKDNAVAMLKVVAKLQPEDNLVAALLKSLTTTDGAETPEAGKK